MEEANVRVAAPRSRCTQLGSLRNHSHGRRHPSAIPTLVRFTTCRTRITQMSQWGSDFLHTHENRQRPTRTEPGASMVRPLWEDTIEMFVGCDAGLETVL